MTVILPELQVADIGTIAQDYDNQLNKISFLHNLLNTSNHKTVNSWNISKLTDYVFTEAYVPIARDEAGFVPGTLGSIHNTRSGRTARSSAGRVQEYCQWEVFRAACPDQSVILMTSARYGRMQVSIHQSKSIDLTSDSSSARYIKDSEI